MSPNSGRALVSSRERANLAVTAASPAPPRRRDQLQARGGGHEPDVRALPNRSPCVWWRRWGQRRWIRTLQFPPVGASRERHSDSAFPLQTISAQRTASQRGSPAQRVPREEEGVPSQGGANIYGKMAGEFAGNRGAPGISPGVKSRPGSADPAALSRIAPEIFTRATEALENIRKTVASAGVCPSHTADASTRRLV